jgi:predicted GIY-YIG superfamily endonuclease
MKKPKQIVHLESFHSRREAMQRENVIKGLNHDAKSALVKLKTRARR